MGAPDLDLVLQGPRSAKKPGILMPETPKKAVHHRVLHAGKMGKIGVFMAWFDR